MTIAVAPMRWWDIPAVMAIEEKVFPDTAWTAAQFWSELAYDDRTYLVVEKADRIVVFEAGRIVAEGTHEALVAEGRIDPGKTVAYYVPELAQSGFGNATLRQVLDMTTGLKYSEDYADPNAEVWAHASAGSTVTPLATAPSTPTCWAG